MVFMPVFDLPTLPDLAAVPTNPASLACTEFQHCDSGPDAWGYTYTGDNGW